jgi:hypothetical protein
MKRCRSLGVFALFFCLTVCMVPTQAVAAFVSGSDGSDGALVVSLVDSITTVTVNGVAVGSELPIDEDGIFNFTTVNVETGATLKFIKNTQNSPVTILTTGDITIDGTVNVGGQVGNYIIPGVGGPGGFDGGVGGVVKEMGKRGEGPGGGVGGSPTTSYDYGGGGGEGGAYSVSGGNGSKRHSEAPGGGGSVAYGNKRIIPLLGGSGGAGGGGTTNDVAGAGGGGGGAILFASSGTIVINGAIYANGGGGANGQNALSAQSSYGGGGGGGGGAGGAIRIVTSHLSGNGTINAIGGIGGYTRQYSTDYRGGTGSLGRIRVEYITTDRTTGTNPPFSSGYALSVTPVDMPSLSITSIAGVNVPTVPMGDFNAPDVVLPYGTTNPTSVVVSAENIPVNTEVTVTANPSVGSSTSGSGFLLGTNSSASATVDLDISLAYPCVLTASVTYELTAALGEPFMLNGELIAKVRVSNSLGGPSSITYITENGREIPAVI